MHAQAGDEIDQLRMMRDEITRGHSASEAVDIVRRYATDDVEEVVQPVRPGLEPGPMRTDLRARAYADETAHSGRIRVDIVDPGATRTRMRQLAFPGEEPDSLKPPEAVAGFVLDRLISESPSGERVRVDG